MTLRLDTTLLLVVALVVALGVVMVASSAVGMSSTFIVRHGIYLAVALLVGGLVLATPLAVWERSHRLAWLVALVLCAVVLIPGVGVEVNGARRWVRVGIMNLQVSEPARLCFLIYLAGYLVRRNKALREEFVGFLRPMLVLTLACLLLLK